MKFGLIIGLVFWLSHEAKAQEARNELFSQQPGRYQIIMSPHNVRDMFLLDTGTGRTWQMTRYTFLADDPVGWSEVPRIDHDTSMLATMQKFNWTAKPRPEAPKTVQSGPPPPPIRLGPQ